MTTPHPDEGTPKADEPSRDDMLSVVLEAGFDTASTLPLDRAGDPRIKEWIEKAYNGEMDYLDRFADAKSNPAGAWPEFRSVIVAALDYGQVSQAPTDPLIGNISRYALGTDYHEVLKRRLRHAANLLCEHFPTLRTRVFVDTGPLNEKLVAARAGLGWVGKHTNLIDRRRGSYLFLGVILTSADIVQDGPPEPDRCGLCDACIPACPTGAIVAPYVLDARRCISYLTIEHRGFIPRDLRPLVGNRIFGCDDCQEVCPWNRFARSVPPDAFSPRPTLRDRTLESWLAVSRDEWRAIFRNSPVKRAGYIGFLRNVLVAAGASGNRHLVGPVRVFLGHQDPILRGHATWALGYLGGEEARRALRELVATETEPQVMEELDAAMHRMTAHRGSPAPRKNEK